jgi:membrane fusion protein (multidrug efflux system)
MHQKLSGLAIVCGVFFLAFGCKEEVAKQPPPPPEITVVEAEQRSMPLYDEYPGQTYGELDIAIRARVEGFLVSRHFEEGSRVQKGQLLYVIDPEPYEAKLAEARSRVAEAQTVLVKAESDLNRIRPLAEENAVSQADLDAAEAQYGAAQASVEAAKAHEDLAKIQLSYSRILAPISGIIGKTEAKVGDFVGREPNPVLLNTISNIENILVRFSIPEAEYLRIRRNYNARKVRNNGESENQGFLELILADGSMHGPKGTLDFAEREIDPSTGTLLLQASFDNPDRIIRPGQYAKIRVPTDYVEDAVLIPQRCVMEMQGQFSAFTVTDSNTVKRVAIEPGRKIGDMIIINQGIQAGDRIVIDALQKVGPDVVVNPVPAEFESKMN